MGSVDVSYIGNSSDYLDSFVVPLIVVFSLQLQLQLSCGDAIGGVSILDGIGYISCAVGTDVSYMNARAGDWNSFVSPLIVVFTHQLQIQLGCTDAIR